MPFYALPLGIQKKFKDLIKKYHTHNSGTVQFQ